MKFGCHLSIRKGYSGAAKQAAAWNAACFQYFPKNPRSLSIKDFDKEDARSCKKYCQDHQIVSIAHTPYATSLTPSEDKKQMTIDSLLNDLDIANSCGSLGVVVHFGSQIDPKNPLASYHLMIEMLNKVLMEWEGECLILLENTAGVPGSIGTTLEELVQVRSLTDYPKKIGFCLDTCHAFASDIWTGNKHNQFILKGNKLGYFKQLKAVHFNNSKYPAASGRDRHANIFKNGHIQENEFDDLIHSKELKHLPFILETPSDEGITHAEEIKQLYVHWQD